MGTENAVDAHAGGDNNGDRSEPHPVTIESTSTTRPKSGEPMLYDRPLRRFVRSGRAPATVAVLVILLVGLSAPSAQAGGLTCRKVVATEATKEGSNALQGSRARCRPDEFLTGGTCYPEVRPEPGGDCQTAAMGVIQTLAESPETTQGAFFTCLQTMGTNCHVEERTRAMAICCKLSTD
jgi:hypothetical protein